MSLRNKSFKYFLVIFSMLGFSGCSIWENFTTYFNLYYNTSTLFEEAEKEIFAQKRDLFSTDPLIVPATTKASLIKVIEKSSKLLQFYSNSSYVNEALLMLGKSFYYQGNYLKSKKKFEEFLAAEKNDEEEIVEANLWLAKCAFELRDFSNALKLLEEVRSKAIEEGYEDIIKESYVQEIKYRIKENDITNAIKLANEFAEVYDDDVVRARIYYELGNMYSKLNDDKNALIAYEKVFENEPDFDLEISATIKYANSLRDNNQPDKALKVFEDIRRKDKFRESYGEIDFQIGKTLVEIGDYNRAYDQFKIVDTTYRNTAFASASNFEMAELFRTRFMNYDSAGYFYAKASTAILPEEYREKAKNNNQLFIKYANLRKDINRFSRQLFYSQNPAVFEKDSSEYAADSLKLLTEFLERKEMQEIWSGVDTLLNPKSPKLKDSTFIKDSIFVRDSLIKIDSLIQIGLFSPQDSIGLRQKLIDSLKTKRLNDLKDPKNPQNIFKNSKVSLDSVKFKRNPPQKLKISIDSAKTVLAKNSLELGNLFLTELNVQDSALVLYESILDKYPSPVYYPNTLYALGSYYLTVNNKNKADSLFEIIYDYYKDRTIVNAAANKLNKPLINLGFDPAKDEYASAEDLMLEGNYAQSIVKFYNIYNKYPKSPIAPQALYTTGWILENDLFLLDSAAVIYDTLIAKYPSSQYVKKVSKKVTAYKQEKTRQEQMLKDSLAALNNKHLTDSTLVADNLIKQDEEKGTDETIIVNDEQIKNQKHEGKEPLEFANQNDKPKLPIKRKLEPLWDPRNILISVNLFLYNMKYRELLDLIEEGENIQCEFKREFSTPEKIARGLMAFANTKGGFMLFGVDDDKKIVGVESEKETAELVVNTAKNLCEPAINVIIDYREVNGKEVVIVNIPESDNKPHRLQDYKSEFDINTAIVTIRVNDKSVLASKEMIRILRAQTNQTALKKYVLGPIEKNVFEYINKTEKISVKELSNLVNISERRASRTLVKMVRANLLMIHTKDNGDEFFTAAV